ncbi:MAG: DUF881 domain-containing protein [Patescibacteria group bacterium]|jgi:uncharacterized protein YlxW (UPF0749 family)
MFKKIDIIILSVTCFSLGVFIVSQFYSGSEYRKVVQPENNEVIALEVAKLTKNNADLRREVFDLTHDLSVYKDAAFSKQSSYEKYQSDARRLSIITGEEGMTGQGISISINGRLAAPQVIDLINAIKNIGADIISVNDKRLVLSDSLSQFASLENYEIKVMGNSKLLKSAMERKGGIVDQISDKNTKISISEIENMTISGTNIPLFQYAKIVVE